MIDLPESVDSDINSEEKLATIPDKYLSNDSKRPLLLVNADGSQSKYALNPLLYCVLFILVIELLERFSYYGLLNSQLEYLVGGYNPEWSANMTSVDASSFVSGSVALGMTAPFIGGVLADGLFGDYFGIIFGTSCLYIPGLLIIALCSYPYLLGDSFDVNALRAGMLVLWPLGMGFIKSIVNVFGAKQYHPKLQSDLIESYYISFYIVINIGSLLGGLVIPIVAQYDVAAAYTIPVTVLALGLIIFCLGSRRYVKAKPDRKALWTSLRILASPLFTCKKIDSNKESNGGDIKDTYVDGLKNLLLVFPATCLILPFSLVYNQMTTVFIVQGFAMRSVGFVDPSVMSNIDSLSVLINGAIYQWLICPSLKKQGKSLKTTHKFAIGTVFGALSILSAIIVDYNIHSEINKGNGPNSINIFWQTISYYFVGAGEILTVSCAYDLAFTIAPKEQKGLASGINLFVFGGLSNFIGIALMNGCSKWFPVDPTDPMDYSDSKLYNYFWVLFGIAICGVIFNFLPPISRWIERIRDDAIELNTNQGRDAETKSSVSSLSSESSSSYILYSDL